jgi:tetratricopeptide (TPR) repeat protein
MTQDLERLRSLLAQNSDDMEVLEQLEIALLQAGDWPGLAELTAEQATGKDPETAQAAWVRLVEGLEAYAESVDSEASLSELALTAGKIWEHELQQPEEAMHRYQRAFEIDSGNVEALRAARATYVTHGSWDMVLQLLNLEVQALGEAHAQAELYLEMAGICLNELGQPGDAVACVRQALKLVPDHPGVEAYTSLLDEVHDERRVRFEQILAEAEQARDARKRAAKLVEAAGLWFEETPSDDQIEALLRKALEADRRNEPARILLEQFFEANARWTDLVAWLEERVQKTARKSDRLAIYQRLASLAQHDMGDIEASVGWHREVLKLSPVEQGSLNFCVDFYSEGEAWLDLVAVYEAALRVRSRGGNESAMLVQIAMILWRKVCDLDGAETYFKRIKLNDPRNGLMLQFYSEYFAAREDWKRLLNILSTRQSIQSQPEAKVALGLEMAEVAEHKLVNREKAIDVWKSVLKIDPSHAEGRDALRRLFFEARKWNALLEFLKDDLKLLEPDDVAAQIRVYGQIIDIYRDQLRLPVMVVNTYNQILQVDPSNVQALDALEKKYESSGRWNDLIGILNRRAEAARAAGDEDAVVVQYRRIAGLWRDKFANPNQSIRYLEGILELQPGDRDAIDQLVAIYEHRKTWPALFSILERKLELLEGAEHVALQAEMAVLATHRLDDRARAIELWCAVRDADAGHEAAWLNLETLYQKAADWSALAELYEARAEGAQGDAAEVEWLKKLAHVAADLIEDEDRAAAVWHHVLELQPGELHAESFLRELYLRRNDWAGLEALFGARGDWDGCLRQLSAAAERDVEVGIRVDLYRRMARICAENLENRPAAVECWERILQEDPDHQEAAEVLAPYYLEVEAWDALVVVLEVILRNAPADPAALMVDLAQVHEHKRGDVGQAFLWYARGLETAPEQAEFLNEARRTASVADAFELLAELLERLIGSTEGDVQLSLRRALAEICHQSLGRDVDAAHHFEQVRREAGDEAVVLVALEELYERLARWDDLLEVRRARLSMATDPAEQAPILASIGALFETVLDQPDDAREVFNDLRTLAPNDLSALHGLQRLAERDGDLDAQAELLGAEQALATDEASRAALRFRMGGLEERRDRPEAALGAYAAVLGHVPGHAGAVAAIEQFLDSELAPQAAAVLEDYLRQTSDWAGLRRALELQVDGSDVLAYRDRTLREVANLREHELGDAEGAFETWQRLSIEVPGDALVREHLERLAADLDAWPVLATHYARLALEGDLVGEDVAVAVHYARRRAHLLEERLGQLEDARTALLSILAEAPDDEDALIGLDRLNTRLNDWRALVEVCERRAELAQSPQAQVALLFRVGDLWEEMLDEPAAAIDVYRRILGAAEGDGRALEALERVFRNVGRFGDLAELLEDRLAEAEGTSKITLGFQLGQVLETRLDDPAGALERYADVLESQPEHEAAQESILGIIEECDDSDRALRLRGCDVLEPVFEMAGEYHSLIHLYQVRLEEADSATDRVALHVQVAATYETEVQDAQAAFASYGAAFGEDYGNSDVLGELERLAEANGSWLGLAAVLRLGLERDDASVEPDVRHGMLARLAVLTDTRLEQLEEAVIFNQEILVDDPDDGEALARLDSLFTRMGETESLVQVLDRRVEVETETPVCSALCFRLGGLLEDALGDAPRAIGVYSHIRGEVDPSDLRAHEALERLFGQTHAYDDLVEVLLDHAERLEDAPARARALQFAAASTLEVALERPADAVDVLQQLLQDNADDRDALSELDRLYGVLEQPIELLDVLERRLALAESDDERDVLGLRIGALQRDALEALPQAVAAFEAVLLRTANQADARIALEGLADEDEVRLEVARILVPVYEANGAWAVLRDILVGTLVDLDAPDVRLETRRRIASIEERQLSDKAAAFQTLAEAYRETEADQALERELERLAADLEAWRALADLFAEVIPNAPDRAVELRLKIAALSEVHLGDAERAINEHREALAIEPDCGPALNALERLFAELGQHAELVDILERKAELADGAAGRKPLLIRAAELQASVLEDQAAAIETWRRVLNDNEAEVLALDALEQLLASTERWPELGSQLEHRLGVADTDAERAPVEFRLATVCQAHLAEGERALELYRAVLEVEPAHQGVRDALSALFADADAADRIGVDPFDVADMLEPLCRGAGDESALVPLLERQQEGSDDSQRRFGLLREIAGLQERALGNAGAAFDACGRALLLDAEDAENRGELHRLAAVAYQYDPLADLLEEAANEAVDPSLKVALLMELGKVEEQHRGQDARARDVFREVLEVEPSHEGAVGALVELFSRTTAWEALVELHLDLAADSSEPEEQKARYFKVCQLLEDVVGDSERAIETYRKVLEIEPDNATAYRALERFYTQLARWDELADLLREEIEYAPDGEARAALRNQLATLLEVRLTDIDGAISAWQTVLQDDASTNTEALDALERLLVELEEADRRQRVVSVLEPLYADRGRWSDWIMVLEVGLEYEDDSWARLDTLVRIAKVHEVELEAPQAAFEAYARAFGHDYGNPDLQIEIDRLGATLGAWSALVDTYLRGIEGFGDLDAAVDILLKVAGLLDTRLDEGLRAIEVYERVLVIDDANEAALDALERLLALADRHEDLVRVLGRKAENVDDIAEKKALWYRIAELWENVLHNGDEAIETYRQIFDEDTEDLVAIEALVRLYERQEQWEQLVLVLREKLELAADDAARKAVLQQIAAIYEERLGEQEETILTWRSVLEADPRDRDALDALDRLYSREGRWGELIDLIEGEREQYLDEDRARSDALELRTGDILEHRLNQSAQAIEIYGSLLEREYEQDAARLALERLLGDESYRLLASRVLEPFYSAQERPDDLARIYELQLLDLEDRAERVELLKLLAKLRYEVLKHPRNAFESYARAFTEEPGDQDVISALNTLADELGLHSELAALYAEQVAQAFDGMVVADLNRRLARLYDQRLNVTRQAIETWQAVLNDDGYDAEALEALDRLYQANQNWHALIEVLRRRVDQAEEAQSFDLRFRLGYLLEAVEDNLTEAIELYRSVLWDNAEHAYSREALERLAVRKEHRAGIADTLEPIYRDDGQWEKLAILTEMRIELSTDARTRAELWVSAAEIREQKLDDNAAALERLVRAFDELPLDEDVRASLIRIATELGAWAQLVDVFEQASARIDDPDLKLDDHLLMAGWCRGRLRDSARAISHYRAALDINPDHARALNALEDLYEGLEDWASLAEIVGRKAESSFDLEEKRARYHQLGALASGRLQDTELATQAYQSALEIDDSDAEAMAALERLYEVAGDWSALRDVLEHRAESTYDGTELARIHRRIGGLARDRLDDLELAAEAFERVVELEPEAVSVLAELREVYLRLHAWDRLQEVLVKALSVTEDPEARREILESLASNAAGKLEQLDDAIEYERQILVMDPADRAVVGRVAALYEQGERWFDLVETLREHVRAAKDTLSEAERVRLLVRIASVAEAELHDGDLAIEALNEVLEVQPEHVGALGVLARLYERGGEWDKAAGTLEKALDSAEPGAERAAARRQLGMLYLDRLDDTDKARGHLQAALDEANDGEALVALLDLARRDDDAEQVLALSELRLAATEGDARVGLLKEIAEIRGAAGDGEGRLAALEEAWSLSSEDLGVADALLDALFAADRHQDAEPVLVAIIDVLKRARRNRDVVRYSFRLGEVAEARGDDAAALAAYQAVFDTDATFVPNLVRLGRLHVKAEDWAKGLRVFQTVLLHQMKLEPAGRVDVFYNLGLIRRAMGEARKARDMFNRALGLDPKHTASREGLESLEA